MRRRRRNTTSRRSPARSPRCTGRPGCRSASRRSSRRRPEDDESLRRPRRPITPTFVPGSPLDGNSILPPDVTVNQDTAGAPQNETAIAVDPNNPNRVVAGGERLRHRAPGRCTISGTPCSALGDGYSGTYFSNDGGAPGAARRTDPQHLGTLIPGVSASTGGPYDAGGDPSVAFDSQGHVFYAGLGFNRASAPNTVAVNRGHVRRLGGNLSWARADVHQPDHLAVDAERQGVDRGRRTTRRARSATASTSRGRASSSTRTTAPTRSRRSSSRRRATAARRSRRPKSIAGNVLYSQGSRPVVGPDGTLYVFWDGSTRLRRAGLDLGRQVDRRRRDVEQAGRRSRR